METGKKLPALAVIMVLLMVSCVIDGGGSGIGKGGIDKGGGSGTAYTVTVSQPEHGTVRASPLNGAEGTTVTLGNTPNIDYQFSHYTVNNAPIAGDTFVLTTNATVNGEFPSLFTTPEEHREMVSMNSAGVSGAFSTGVFANGRAVYIQPFKIAKYQTTYELWKEVYEWARKNGYSFANEGKEGYPYSGDSNQEMGTDSAAWTAKQKKTRPVTMVNWRDAIVWCNAYSEMSGRTPVYYTSTNFSTVLKTSTNTDADNAARKDNVNGYRLPAEVEWEYAARGGDPSAPEWNYQYAGTNIEAELDGYAWYNANSGGLGSGDDNYGAHPVGILAANSAGLYDMSGNAAEWCWDWYDTTINAGTNYWGAAGPGSLGNRVTRGGGWNNTSTNLGSASRGDKKPYEPSSIIGFRVVRSQ